MTHEACSRPYTLASGEGDGNTTSAGTPFAVAMLLVSGLPAGSQAIAAITEGDVYASPTAGP
ncbi:MULTISPECIES: hypothetical protein [unclassified Streptomyces]|uniref:hypothetical protein n=1 Tax=unclassified Streptomyces TaxID=2593676 RepID=UPI003413F0B5